MNKKIVIIVLATILAVVFLLKQEFSTVPVQAASGADVQSPPATVEQAEEEQIMREFEAQNKAANISRDYMVKCAPCHSKDGSGPVGAAIDNLSKEELIQALRAYKVGDEHNGLMDGLMKNISDADIDRLAEEISNF